MSLDDDQLKMLVLDLLKNPGERDKQTLIGASEIGNPCLYCLANRLLKTPKRGSQYWLGAKLGTAMHRELEHEEVKHIQVAQNYRFEVLEGARIEQAITLGSIDGYGEVRSKPDLVITSAQHLVDWKSSTKKKVAGYKLDGVPMQYVYQQQLYAWGLNNMGIPVTRISLVFINRDGTGDNDVWIYSFDYNEGLALKVWKRLETVWEWLQKEDSNVEDLESDPNCYYCNQVLRRF